ncbi:hypothetical protein [Lentzea sp. NPDC055074]
MRFATTEAAKGWEELCRAAKSSVWEAWVVLTERPRSSENLSRQHRLKGAQARNTYKGNVYDQWQYEVTSGGRIWYVIDEERKTVWITHAGTGHPKLTD